MYNPKYVINRPLGDNEVIYPKMFYRDQSGDKEVPIKLVRLTQPIPKNNFDLLHVEDFRRKFVYWTDDNVDDIIDNLSKPNSNQIYFITDRSRPMINPFESDINCEKRKNKEDFDYYNFYNCHPYKYVYLLEFREASETNNFLASHVFINYILPTFEEYNPYEYILYITILGRTMNFFNMKVSSALLYYICEKLIENFKPIIKQAFTTFSQETLNIINGPYKIILNSMNYKYLNLYCETEPELYNIIIPDINYIWFNFIDHNNTSFKCSDVKIQMCIKEEYIYWVVNKLLLNLDRLIYNNVYAFKFFVQIDKYLGNYATKFPSFETNLVNEQFEKYIFQGKEYKREIKTPPNVVFYLSNNVNIKNVIDLLNALFPNSQSLNHKIISNRQMPRHNFRLTENICLSIDGDNQNKNEYSKLNLTYIDDNIPSEYTEIINIAKRYVLNQEQCNLFNKYTNNISGHDLLKYEDGQCSINNILSYKGIIGNKRSFFNLFQQLNLLDYYEKEYNSTEFNMFKQNVIETSPTQPLSAGYRINKNKKLSKRLSDKQKKYMSKKYKKQ
jgi:hypothetical protein